MQDDTGVWAHYTPGFIDPLYVPYLREKVKDRWGNEVEINRWKKQGSPAMVQPELVRINQGLAFQRMFESDPCPIGWTKPKNNEGPPGYCYQAPLRHEPVFYTDKAFIAQNQYWQGPADGFGSDGTSASNGVRNRNQNHRTISEQTDMRSVDPTTGDYKVYFHPVVANSQVRYVTPTPGPEKYDGSWNKHRQHQYAQMATTDSYLA